MADDQAQAASRVRYRKTREIAERAIAEGLTPLQYMLAVMRDEKADILRRDEMAMAAAPYVHPRLQAIEQRPSKERVPPLHERIAELERREAIADKRQRVVSLRAAGDAG